MKEFLVFFLVNWGLMVILYKYKINDFLSKLSDRLESRFIYDLSECQFCIEHHVGTIVIMLYIAVSVLVFKMDVDWLALAYPFMSASLSNIVKSLIVKK